MYGVATEVLPDDDWIGKIEGERRSIVLWQFAEPKHGVIQPSKILLISVHILAMVFGVFSGQHTTSIATRQDGDCRPTFAAIRFRHNHEDFWEHPYLSSAQFYRIWRFYRSANCIREWEMCWLWLELTHSPRPSKRSRSLPANYPRQSSNWHAA